MTRQTGKPNIPSPQPVTAELVPQSSQPLQTQETAASAVAAHSEAMVKARYAIAVSRPRDIDGVRTRLIRECERPLFAKAAIYHKPVGRGVDGLSIRFAEAALQTLGNVWVESPVVYDDQNKRILQVTVIDLETNTGYSVGVTVPKRVERSSPREGEPPLSVRINSKGDRVYTVLATDDEILNLQGALVSKAIRTEGLRLIPQWLQDECWDTCVATQKKEDAKDPDAARRRLYDAFSKIGVTPEMINSYLGHPGDLLTPDEGRLLLAIYNAIKDKETTWAEAVENRRKESKTAAKTEAPKAPAPPPPAEPPKDAPAAGKPRCDGNHKDPPCGDPQCWLTGDREPERG